MYSAQPFCSLIMLPRRFIGLQMKHLSKRYIAYWSLVEFWPWYGMPKTVSAAFDFAECGTLLERAFWRKVPWFLSFVCSFIGIIASIGLPLPSIVPRTLSLIPSSPGGWLTIFPLFMAMVPAERPRSFRRRTLWVFQSRFEKRWGCHAVPRSFYSVHASKSCFILIV